MGVGGGCLLRVEVVVLSEQEDIAFLLDIVYHCCWGV